MAKRKQSKPYTKKAVAAKPLLRQTAYDREEDQLDTEDSPYYPSGSALELLRETRDQPGATQKELDDKQDLRIHRLRGLLEPQEETTLKGMSAPKPVSPYPFKNPVTMTKDLDDSVRELRTKYSPGAGTAQPSVVTHNPQLGLISQMANQESGLGEAIARGYRTPDNLNLLGMAKQGVDKRDVYINPSLKGLGQDTTLAHELSHMNIPQVDDGWGNYSKPGAEMTSVLRRRIGEREKYPKGTPKRKTADEMAQELVDALTKAGIKGVSIGR